MPFTSTMRDVPATRRSRAWRRAIALSVALLWVGTAYWHANKALPPGMHVDSPWYSIAPKDVTFIADITSADAYGRTIVSQGIFDEMLQTVRSARRFIVLDYFLFNGLSSVAPDDGNGNSEGSGPPLRPLSAELRDALIEARRAQPDLQVLLITDPINEVYGGAPSHDLRLLRAAGVEVAVTDLDRLRDSNFIYSSLWRLGIGWWNGGSGQGPGRGWLPNPLDESDVPISFGAWARLANFKANHRKVLIADDGHDGLVGIVGSANPHDASSAHSNIALKASGPLLQPLLESELAIAHFSGWKGSLTAQVVPVPSTGGGSEASRGSEATRAKILTEGAIRAALLERMDAAVSGDGIDIAMFYISDRGIVESLLAASRRGVAVRLILDPNKDAFGHAKSGIPNRPVASELAAASDGAIHIRWYRTHGEQFHTKLALIYGPRRLWLTAGSANFTRRNLADYNLEANVAVDYFETLWGNRASLGIEYTADFGYYSDPSQLHYWLYRVMEATGLSTF
jgi:phosphatidylserine/phosphatidylglycerophosphate/cardiolipin synthase-like enzyme